MSKWENLVRRKYDYTIDVGTYSLGINRDFNLVIDEDTVNSKFLESTLQKVYPDFRQSNIIVAVARETKYQFEELSERMTRFINKIN
jgi:asparagine synthetase A